MLGKSNNRVGCGSHRRRRLLGDGGQRMPQTAKKRVVVRRCYRDAIGGMLGIRGSHAPAQRVLNKKIYGIGRRDERQHSRPREGELQVERQPCDYGAKPTCSSIVQPVHRHRA